MNFRVSCAMQKSTLISQELSYLVGRESRDKSLLERPQPMVGPDETLVQQFRVRGCLGIDRLQLEHHHIFTPSLLVSLLFLELVSRLRWPSRDALTFITHTTQFSLRILVHISRFIARGGAPPRDLTLYCQASRIILSGTRYTRTWAAATHLAKSHPPLSRVDFPSDPPDHRKRKERKREREGEKKKKEITFSSKILHVED